MAYFLQTTLVTAQGRRRVLGSWHNSIFRGCRMTLGRFRYRDTPSRAPDGATRHDPYNTPDQWYMVRRPHQGPQQLRYDPCDSSHGNVPIPIYYINKFYIKTLYLLSVRFLVLTFSELRKLSLASSTSLANYTVRL